MYMVRIPVKLPGFQIEEALPILAYVVGLLPLWSVSLY